MHLVRSLDWGFATVPHELASRSSGFAARGLVGRAVGAVHSELSVARLQPGGWVDPHVHAYEAAVYVLAGGVVLEREDRRLRLQAGDYALLPIGTVHAWSNVGDEEARLLSIATPVRVQPQEGRQDTFFVAHHGGHEAPVAATPELDDPRLRGIGHYEGTPPQAQALAVSDPARGRRPAGMDTAILAYSGISVRMLVDRNFGAELLTMFTVDYEPGGAAQVHDHPFEETYFFLAGEIEAELDGKLYTVRAGDVVFAGVGSTHGFFNTGAGRVRWIETQAPQPPMRHAYRWVDAWRRFGERLGEGG
jgi:quercetin dioxygenase-like cupin family protein